jgi:hypothetical protein
MEESVYTVHDPRLRDLLRRTTRQCRPQMLRGEKEVGETEKEKENTVKTGITELRIDHSQSRTQPHHTRNVRTLRTCANAGWKSVEHENTLVRQSNPRQRARR